MALWLFLVVSTNVWNNIQTLINAQIAGIGQNNDTYSEYNVSVSAHAWHVATTAVYLS